jgi:hypothetical protein
VKCYPAGTNLTAQHKAAIAGVMAMEHAQRGITAQAHFGGGFRALTANDKATPAIASYNQLEALWNPIIQPLFAPAAAAPTGQAAPRTVPALPNKPVILPAPGTQIAISWNPITFSGGTTVGGQMQLILNSNGNYNFNGSFNDTGVLSYDDAISIGVVSSAGTLFTFSHSGSMAGGFSQFFGGGSSTDSWSNTGNNPQIQAGWAELWSGYIYQAKASTNLDLGQLFTDLVNLIKQIAPVVETVVQVVGALAA